MTAYEAGLYCGQLLTGVAFWALLIWFVVRSIKNTNRIKELEKRIAAVENLLNSIQIRDGQKHLLPPSPGVYYGETPRGVWKEC